MQFTSSGPLQPKPGQGNVKVNYIDSLATLPIFGGSAAPASTSTATTSAATASPSPTATPAPADAESAALAPPELTGGTAVVRDGNPRFFFSLDTASVFSWNDTSTKNNTRDVQWTVQMQLGDETFAFRLAHVKRGNAEQRIGNLQDFIAEAQLAVRETSAAGARPQCAPKISTRRRSTVASYSFLATPVQSGSFERRVPRQSR